VKSAYLTTALSHTSCPSAVSRLCLTRLSLGCASLSSISASAARDDGGADGGEVGGRNRRGHLGQRRLEGRARHPPLPTHLDRPHKGALADVHKEHAAAVCRRRVLDVAAAERAGGVRVGRRRDLRPPLDARRALFAGESG